LHEHQHVITTKKTEKSSGSCDSWGGCHRNVYAAEFVMTLAVIGSFLIAVAFLRILYNSLKYFFNLLQTLYKIIS